MTLPNVSFEATHATDLGGAPVLDAATFGALAELAGDDDPDLIADLVQLFLEDSNERMGSITTSMTDGDVQNVGAAAHALKSSGANIGALEFSKACADLEGCARAVEAGVTDLQPIVERTQRLYEEVIAALSGLNA